MTQDDVAQLAELIDRLVLMEKSAIYLKSIDPEAAKAFETNTLIPMQQALNHTLLQLIHDVKE